MVENSQRMLCFGHCQDIFISAIYSHVFMVIRSITYVMNDKRNIIGKPLNISHTLNFNMDQ